jgi:hypothetical protein
MLKIVAAAVIADGGLFLVDPRYGAMGGVALVLALFVAGVVSSTK